MTSSSHTWLVLPEYREKHIWTYTKILVLEIAHFFTYIEWAQLWPAMKNLRSSLMTTVISCCLDSCIKKNTIEAVFSWKVFCDWILLIPLFAYNRCREKRVRKIWFEGWCRSHWLSEKEIDLNLHMMMNGISVIRSKMLWWIALVNIVTRPLQLRE